MCMPLAQPKGAAPKPGGAPAACGGETAPKTPPRAEPELAAAAGSGASAPKAQPEGGMGAIEAFNLAETLAA
eukprot:885325-Alexandrium_andersonii.AAC.1